MRSLFFLCSLLISLDSSASEANTEHSWGRLLSGALTTLALHESAHYLLAKNYGFDVALDGTSIVYPDWQPTKQQQLRVASIGFQAQWLASEFAFTRLQPKKSTQNLDDDYYRGIIWGHIAISLAYISLKNDDRSDVYAIADATGHSRNEILAGLLLSAGLDTARLTMKKPPKWLKHVSFASKGLGIAAIWQF